jgi:hypothetical protein
MLEIAKRSYLMNWKATGLKVGMLVNFGRVRAEYKRLVF